VAVFISVKQLRKFMRIAKYLLAMALVTGGASTYSVKATPASFTGSYTNSFDNLGTSGTTLPAGFRTMTLAGGNSTYTAANPITPAAIAGATPSGTQTLTTWASGSAVAASGSSLFNCGSVGNNADRALGTDPTGIGAMVIELSLTNNTGSNLAGVVFVYDCKCLTNGSGGNGTEAAELPGYSFFYSLTGSANAADWIPVAALSIPNYTQGAVSNSGNVAITFPAPLTNGGIMYFRWADDNCMTVSPDQMLAIDNIGITTYVPITPTVSITSPLESGTFPLGSGIALTANAAAAGSTITNVAFYANSILLGNVASAPYNLTWTNIPSGSFALTAVAADNSGVSSISSMVNVTVTNMLAIPTLRQIKTVFVIGMENHNFTQPIPTNSPQQLLGNPAAPYINSLITPGNPNAAQVSYATKYYNVGQGVHPSEPNYVWAEAGTDFGVYSDMNPGVATNNLFNAPHFTRQLNTAGISWKNYQEDIQFGSSPTNDAVSTSATAINPYYGTGQYGYAARHNPMGFFTDTQTQNVYALTNLSNDLAHNAVGRYNWITPNLFNDMHTPLSGGFTYQGVSYTGDQAGVAQGDNFLATIIPRIMASTAYQDHGIIIIHWDETENGDGTNYTIPEIIISPMAKGNAYASNLEMSHSSDVKTLDEIFGLPLLTNAVPAADINAAGTGYNNVSTVNDLGDMVQDVGLVTPYNLHCSKMAAGGCAVSFNTGANQPYRVMAAANANAPLNTWTQIGSGTAMVNPVVYMDTNILSSRFYRVVSP
jgi:phosphatidylinositol-3-phosphatase